MFSAASAAVAGLAALPAFAVYQGKPAEEPPKIVAKEKCAFFVAQAPSLTAGNTLYPEKKLVLDKKSPVDRLDLAPPSFETYQKTYPGLTTAFTPPTK